MCLLHSPLQPIFLFPKPNCEPTLGWWNSMRWWPFQTAHREKDYNPGRRLVGVNVASNSGSRSKSPFITAFEFWLWNPVMVSRWKNRSFVLVSQRKLFIRTLLWYMKRPLLLSPTSPHVWNSPRQRWKRFIYLSKKNHKNLARVSIPPSAMPRVIERIAVNVHVYIVKFPTVHNCTPATK